MSPEKALLLQNRYPSLYGARGHSRPVYFDVGDGWFDLLDALSARIQAAWNAAASSSEPVDFTVVQIKQKFGGLRYYADGRLLDVVHEFIEEAARKADVTCEVCGSPGETAGRGYIQTLCAEHAKEVR